MADYQFNVQPFQVHRREFHTKFSFVGAVVQTDCKPKTRNALPYARRAVSAKAIVNCKNPFPRNTEDFNRPGLRVFNPFGELRIP